jgi:hypothetical protein
MTCPRCPDSLRRVSDVGLVVRTDGMS